MVLGAFDREESKKTPMGGTSVPLIQQEESVMAKGAMMCDFSVSLPDRPGELARLASLLSGAGVNLVGLWGYGPSQSKGQGKARFYCVPERAEQFRDFAQSEGLDFDEGKTFYLTGADHPGALTECLDKIASAGINLHAIDAVRAHGEFSCFVWADAKDWDTLAKVLT